MAILLAFLAAAQVAAAAPAAEPGPPGGLLRGEVGAVVRGGHQTAVITEPRYRLSDRPTGRDGEPCTVVAGNGNVIWQAAGCVFIASGLGNRVNGRSFPPGAKVCIGRRKRPGLCRARHRFLPF